MTDEVTKPINSQFQLRGQYSQDAAERKVKFAKSAELNDLRYPQGEMCSSAAVADSSRLSELPVNPSYTLINT